jgi:hypothetical protein
VVIDSRDGRNSYINTTGGSFGVFTASPQEKLHVGGNARIDGALIQSELSADPPDPPEGQSVVWQSDGTGSGGDGDIMVKITAGGVTKTATLIDFSAV